jgi:hypothetical protein
LAAVLVILFDIVANIRPAWRFRRFGFANDLISPSIMKEIEDRGFVRSLYGCLSSRCKSGRGNWLFARVVILDIPMG